MRLRWAVEPSRGNRGSPGPGQPQVVGSCSAKGRLIERAEEHCRIRICFLTVTKEGLHWLSPTGLPPPAVFLFLSSPRIHDPRRWEDPNLLFIEIHSPICRPRAYPRTSRRPTFYLGYRSDCYRACTEYERSSACCRALTAHTDLPLLGHLVPGMEDTAGTCRSPCQNDAGGQCKT